MTLEEEKSRFENARTGGVASDAGKQIERGGEGDADGDSEGELLFCAAYFSRHLNLNRANVANVCWEIRCER